jgi:hypothetical protein
MFSQVNVLISALEQHRMSVRQRGLVSLSPLKERFERLEDSEGVKIFFYDLLLSKEQLCALR